jgi:N-acetylglucosaminyldiphosphoundecaprenol N-acetyl-beta-D-mannosaminyltransferase
LPERVCGTDLLFDLCASAERRGYRVFLLGGMPEALDRAARNLRARYPNLNICGSLSPPFRELTAEDMTELIGTIKAARPDLLITAFTMPRGERLLATHHRALGVPVSVNFGAAIDFAAGRFSRAPRWLQNAGLEWAYRLFQEPRRLGRRYAANFLFLARMTLTAVLSSNRGGRRPTQPVESTDSTDDHHP